jgi:hypothetical protein
MRRAGKQFINIYFHFLKIIRGNILQEILQRKFVQSDDKLLAVLDSWKHCNYTSVFQIQFSADYLPLHIKLTQLKSLPNNPFNEGFDSVHKIAQKKVKCLFQSFALFTVLWRESWISLKLFGIFQTLILRNINITKY